MGRNDEPALPGSGDPAQQLRLVVQAMMGEREDLDLGIIYDLDFLELVAERCGEVQVAADQATLLSDCRIELERQGVRPGLVATVNAVLLRLVAGNLADLARRGITPAQARRGFRQAADFQAARDRMEP